MFRAAACVVAVMGIAATPALAGDRALLTALDTGLGPTAAASRAAASGAPSLVQLHYDRARDLQERVRAAAPFSASCHATGGWAGRYAAAEVASAEGFDRLDSARARRFRLIAAAARGRLAAARRACRPATALRVAAAPVLLDPRPAAATFGDIAAAAPPGADDATLFANGAPAGPLRVSAGRARATLVGRAGRYDLEVRFRRAGVAFGVARSAGVWLLPASAGGTVHPAAVDAGLQAAVRSAAGAFAGISGVWVHDLASGRAASWNAGARFPAASTVKLGVIVEALRRMGPHPERSALFHDVEAVGGWSSNLGANRLLRRVGGSGDVQAALARMGAMSSTYTGPYIVATERPPVDAPSPPPRVSRRVTTAYDLGTVMRTLHEAALGDAGALSRTRLNRAQARLGLGLLLSSEQVGDNRGLLRDALGPAAPAAQKQGWISSARHSTAVIYTERGPVVVAVLTYRPGLTRGAAAALGGRIVRLATPAP